MGLEARLGVEVGVRSRAASTLEAWLVRAHASSTCARCARSCGTPAASISSTSACAAAACAGLERASERRQYEPTSAP